MVDVICLIYACGDMVLFVKLKLKTKGPEVSGPFVGSAVIDKSYIDCQVQIVGDLISREFERFGIKGLQDSGHSYSEKFLPIK